MRGTKRKHSPSPSFEEDEDQNLYGIITNGDETIKSKLGDDTTGSSLRLESTLPSEELAKMLNDPNNEFWTVDIPTEVKKHKLITSFSSQYLKICGLAVFLEIQVLYLFSTIQVFGRFF